MKSDRPMMQRGKKRKKFQKRAVRHPETLQGDFSSSLQQPALNYGPLSLGTPCLPRRGWGLDQL